MTGKRVFAVTAAVLAGCLLTGAPAAASRHKAIVTMSVALSATSVAQDAGVTLSGRAYHGASGNAGKVDVYFKASTGHAYTPVASTTASSNGAFHKTVTAATSGTYEVIYRGNTTRTAATRHVTLRVYVMKDVKTTVYHETSDVDPSCANQVSSFSCIYQSPVIPIANGPLYLHWSGGCTHAQAGLTVGYTTTPTEPGGHRPPGWMNEYYGFGPQDADLRPTTRNGFFYIAEQDGGHGNQPDPSKPLSCSWDVTAYQMTLTKVSV